MTTNGDDDVRVTNGDVSCAIEGGVRETSCDRCRELTEELQKRRRDHTIYTALKKKISLTDSLIKKYNSKCQEFDQQQNKLQEVTSKLASKKGDCKVLEEQLTLTLKEIIPWKCDKNKFSKEFDDCKKRLSETEDKLNGSEALCVQLESKLADIEDKLETVQDNYVKQKRKTEKCQQTEMKALTVLSKNKDDLANCKKDLRNAKNRESSLVTRHQMAKNKISELIQLLRDHGISVPKIPVSLRGGTASNQDRSSTEDIDFEPVDEDFSPPEIISSPPQKFSSPPKQEPSPDDPEPKEQSRENNPEEDTCHVIFERFSTSEMVSCMSPLPASPQPSLQEEMHSDSSSYLSVDDGEDDNAFSDVADEIDNLMEGGDHQEQSHHEETEKPQDGRSNEGAEDALKITYKRSKKLPEVFDDLCDDSEKETSEKSPVSNHQVTPDTRKAEAEKQPLSMSEPGHVEALLTDKESRNIEDNQARSVPDGHKTENSDSEEVGLSTHNTRRGRKLRKVDKSRNRSPVKVSDKAPPERNQEEQSDDIFRLSGTLSEDSDNEDDEKVNPKRKPSEHIEEKILSSDNLSISPPIQRRLLSPAQRDFPKSEGAAVVAKKKLPLSPDRRLTRSQLKMIASFGEVESTGSADANSINISPIDEEASHCDQAENKPFQDAPEIQVSPELAKSDENYSYRRPVTRSLSHSENESSSEPAPPSSAKSFQKRALRFDSRSEEKHSPQKPSSASPTENIDKTESEQSDCIDVSSPTRQSPRKLLRSVSLTQHASDSGSDIEKKQTGDGDFQTSGAVSLSLEEQSPRRMTRSQKHTLGSAAPDKMIPTRLTRSVAKNLKTNPEASRRDKLRRRSNSDTSLKAESTCKTELFKGLCNRPGPIVCDNSAIDSKKTQSDFFLTLDNSNSEAASMIQPDTVPCGIPENSQTGVSPESNSTSKINVHGGTGEKLVMSDWEADSKGNLKGQGQEWLSSKESWTSHEIPEEHLAKGVDTPVSDGHSCREDMVSIQGTLLEIPISQPSGSKLLVRGINHLESDIGNENVTDEVSSYDSAIPVVEFLGNSSNLLPEEKDPTDFQGKVSDPSGDDDCAEFIEERNSPCITGTQPRILHPEPQTRKRTSMDDGDDKAVCKNTKTSFHASEKDKQDSRSPLISESDARHTKGDSLNVECGGIEATSQILKAPGGTSGADRFKLEQNEDGGQVEQMLNSTLQEPAEVPNGRTKSEDVTTAGPPDYTLQVGNEILKGTESDAKAEAMIDTRTENEVRQRVAEHMAAGAMEDGNSTGTIKQRDEHFTENNRTANSASHSQNTKENKTADINGEGSNLVGTLGGIVNQESVQDQGSLHTGVSCILGSFPLPTSQEAIPCNSEASQQQVVCVEAESSRASTPTTEVMSINSMSGQVSPVSPLHFQEYNRTSPLSPLASCHQSQLVSPLDQSPNIFQGMVSFPRILSPLPPSPGIPELMSEEDNVDLSPAEGVVVADVVSQPRMISPLFPTPVPQVVSPLLEPPILLSPLSDTSPPRPRDFNIRDRSPMISPLRNPLIPSPCNFHAEAPRDALSVRPQHYPTSRRQPASRCLAASFTGTSPPGMSQAPEIISPRLHSLASELVFEFGESQPSTSGLHRQRLFNMASNATQDLKPASQRVKSENKPKYPEEFQQTAVKHGFKKIQTKSANAKNKALIEKSHETPSQAELMGQTDAESVNLQQKEQKQLSGNCIKFSESPQKVEYGPRKTRSRNRTTAGQEGSPDKSPGASIFVPEDNKTVSNKTLQDVEKVVPRRFTRSQSGTSKNVAPNFNHAVSKTSTPSSLLRRKCEENGKDSKTIQNSSKRRKHSKSSSGETEVMKRVADPKVDEQMDASLWTTSGDISSPLDVSPRQLDTSKCAPPEPHHTGYKTSTPSSLLHRKRAEVGEDPETIQKSSKRKKHSRSSSGETELTKRVVDPEIDGQTDASLRTTSGDTFLSQPERSDLPSFFSGSRRTLLIPALELKKTSGFKKSGSWKRIQDIKQDLEAPAKTETDFEAPAVLEKVTAKPDDVGDDNSSTHSGRPKTPENDPSVGEVNIEKNLEGDRSSPGSRSPDTAVESASIHDSGDLKRSPLNRSNKDKITKQTPKPTLIADGSQQSASATSTKVDDSKIQQENVAKSTKVKSKIGNVWGDMAARKEPGFAIFNWNKKNKIRPFKEDILEPSQPIRIQAKSDTGQHKTLRLGAKQETTNLPPDAAKSKLPTGAKSQTDETKTSQMVSSGPSTTRGTCSIPPLADMPRPTAIKANFELSGPDPETAYPTEDLKMGNPDATVQPQAKLGSTVLTSGLQSKQARVRKSNAETVKEFPRQIQGVREPAKTNLDSRKRSFSGKGNKTCNTDEQPTPKQLKMITTGQPWRPEGTKSVSKVIPVVQESDHGLAALLQQIKGLRSVSNIKPVIAAIMNFLGNQAISLMPAIHAKCLVQNTNPKPLLLEHEQMLVTCIMKSVISTKKSNMSMFMACLCRGVHRPRGSTELRSRLIVCAAYCRMLAALGRLAGGIERVRVFCYDLLREGLPDAEELLLNVAVTWATVLKRRDGTKALPLCSAMEVIVMQRLARADSHQLPHAQQLMNCFQSICEWEVPSGDAVTNLCQRLVASIQDHSITKFFFADKSGFAVPLLTSKSYEIVKTLELCAHHQGWEWTNNHLIREQLWPILKIWSQSLQKTASQAGTGSDRLKPAGSGKGVESPADVSACAVMKIIGNVASVGLASNKQSAYELLKMLAGVLQQPTESVPLSVQVYTAEAVLSLSPSNPPFALGVIQQWKTRLQTALPGRMEDKLMILAKCAGAASTSVLK